MAPAASLLELADLSYWVRMLQVWVFVIRHPCSGLRLDAVFAGCMQSCLLCKDIPR